MKKRLTFTAVILAALCALICVAGCSVPEDWVRKTIQKNYYRFDGDYSSIEDMDNLTIEEMVGRLDPYSAYYTAAEYEAMYADNGGSKSGVGISYAFEPGIGIVIHSVIGNSPAKRAGIKEGDVIVSAGVSQDEEIIFSEHENTFADFINARAAGEEFSLNLSDGRRVTLCKADYTASYACMYTHDKSYDIEYNAGAMSLKVGENGIKELPQGTAYIYLRQFYGNAYGEMIELLSEFNAESCTSLVLDLRGNGGGYVELMSEIGGLFTSRLGGGRHVSMVAEYKDGTREVSYCKDISSVKEEYAGTLPAGTTVYLMANRNTASASEALAGILISYDILKYENVFLSQYPEDDARSYGKGIMQSVFTHASGARLKLTVAGIYWQNGTTIHGKGLTADDGCVAAPTDDLVVNVGYDDELEYVINKINKTNAVGNAAGA